MSEQLYDSTNSAVLRAARRRTIDRFDNVRDAARAQRQRPGRQPRGARVQQAPRDSRRDLRTRQRHRLVQDPPGARVHPVFHHPACGEGVGLGLSISHDILAPGHQGEIRADSVEGEYMEFIITLPRKESGRPAMSPVSLDSSCSGASLVDLMYECVCRFILVT